MTDVTQAQVLDAKLRRGLATVYGLCLLAGLVALLGFPPPAVVEVGRVTARAWGIFMLAGASASMVGVLIPRTVNGHWFGEFVGLPPLSAGVALYGAAITAHALQHNNGRTPAGFLLLGFALCLAIRWWWTRADGNLSCPPTTDGR